MRLGEIPEGVETHVDDSWAFDHDTEENNNILFIIRWHPPSLYFIIPSQ
jgi:hypothetical protein